MAVIPLTLDQETGVLVLLDRKETIGPFLIIKDDIKLPIIALRQPPELCGIDEPELSREEKEVWTQPYRKQFCDSLQKAINKSGVKKLFIANGVGGKAWRESSYSECVSGVEVIDAKEDIKLDHYAKE